MKPEELDARKNTDKELWRESPDYRANSIHVTEGGGIGINVGGHVIVKPLKEWHKLAATSYSYPSPLPDSKTDELDAIGRAIDEELGQTGSVEAQETRRESLPADSTALREVVDRAVAEHSRKIEINHLRHLAERDVELERRLARIMQLKGQLAEQDKEIERLRVELRCAEKKYASAPINCRCSICRQTWPAIEMFRCYFCASWICPEDAKKHFSGHEERLAAAEKRLFTIVTDALRDGYDTPAIREVRAALEGAEATPIRAALDGFVDGMKMERKPSLGKEDER